MSRHARLLQEGQQDSCKIRVKPTFKRRSREQLLPCQLRSPAAGWRSLSQFFPRVSSGRTTLIPSSHPHCTNLYTSARLHRTQEAYPRPTTVIYRVRPPPDSCQLQSTDTASRLRRLARATSAAIPHQAGANLRAYSHWRQNRTSQERIPESSTIRLV